MFGKNCEPFGCAFRQSNQKTLPEGHFLLANFSQKFDQKLCLWAEELETPPEGHFLLANFSQKFDQKLVSDPKGSFYSIFCEKIGLYPKSSDKRNKETPDYNIRSRTRICLFTDQPLIKFMNFGFYRCQIPAAPDDI